MNQPGRTPEGMTQAGAEGRISLLDWKATNLRNSWLLGGFMVLLLGAIGYLLGMVVDPSLTVVFVAIAVILAVGQTGVAYWFSDKIALAATSAREATREEHRYLVNITEAVSMGAGVPVPKIYVIDHPSPNAFATGRNPENGAIAVTTGLMEMMDRQELEGVVAHEMAHIRNYDMLFGSMIAATLGAIILLRDLVMRSMFYGGGRSRGSRSSNSGGGNKGGGGGQAIGMILLVVLLVLAPLLATFLHLAVSRKREYLADASGAYITRNPEGLARALEKLQNYSAEPMKVSDGVRHLFFVNPVAKLNANALGSTHPPIEDRIRRLRQM